MAEYVDNRIKDLGATGSESDLTSGNYVVLDGSNGTKKLPANKIAKNSDMTTAKSDIASLSMNKADATSVNANFAAMNAKISSEIDRAKEAETTIRYTNIWSTLTNRIPQFLDVKLMRPADEENEARYYNLVGVKTENSVPVEYAFECYLENVLYTLVATEGDEGAINWDEGKIDLNGAKNISIVSNEEYVFGIVDSEGSFLFGIKKSGDVEWAKGIPTTIKKKLVSLHEEIDENDKSISELESKKVDKEDSKSLIDSKVAESVYFVSDENYAFAIIDSSSKFLFGIRIDGSIDWPKENISWAKSNFSRLNKSINRVEKKLDDKLDKENGKSLIDELYAKSQSSDSTHEFVKVLVGSSGEILESYDTNGKHTINTDTEFKGSVGFEGDVEVGDSMASSISEALKLHGFSADLSDWSDADSVRLPKPSISIVNITGVSAMPESKTENAHGYIQFWDMLGNYFKKKVILNAQGSGTLKFPKKNISIDLCNDDWEGDDTFSVRFGDWVSQDSFHLKAFYNDFFRGVAIAGFKVWRDMQNTLGEFKNRTWKLGKITENLVTPVACGISTSTDLSSRLDNGALCFPDGFPCVVYLNGDFYGIFSFNLKKHRDNYSMSKSDITHIHIDPGSMKSIFNSSSYSSIDWTLIEIRNPKNLICMDGSSYDGDNPSELIDSSSEHYDSSNKKHKNTAAVKKSILSLRTRFADAMSKYRGKDYDGCMSILEEMFDIDNILDYQLFIDWTQNADGEDKNWQWTTWDGVKWYVNPYDLDSIFGSSTAGEFIRYPMTGMTIFVAENPCFLAKQLYASRMNERYSKLRSAGIFNADSVKADMLKWIQSFTEDDWKNEFSKWNECPANLPTILNDGWEFVLNDDGTPACVYSETSDIEYSSTTQYNAGDIVTIRDNSIQNWFFKVKATQQETGVNPIKSYGACDSYWRLCKWLDINVSLRDSFYNYQGE